ncbi:hypothetical protein ACFL5V_01435 [Fibrobacterota bacterium]
MTQLSCDSGTDSEGCTPKAVPADTGSIQYMVILKPLGCEEYSQGDTIFVEWEYRKADVNDHMTAVQLSVDNGLSFEHLFTSSIPTVGADGSNIDKGQTHWVIPNDAAYVSNQAIIKVYDYANPGENDQSNPFAIK